MGKDARYETFGDMTEQTVGLEEDRKLQQAVAERLAELPNEEFDEPLDPVEKEESEAETPTDIPDNRVGPEEGEENEPAELPYNYRRAAIGAGWSEDDINEFYGADPERATKTFQNIYAASKMVSEQLSSIGRTAKELQQQQTAPPGQTAESKPTSGNKPFVDVGKLKEQYGDDVLIDGFIAPMNQAIAELREELAQARTSTPTRSAPSVGGGAPTNVEPDAAVVQVIDNFFSSEPMVRAYGDFYGTTNDPMKLTLEQRSNRHALIEEADRIIYGALAQGKQMDVADALERAHFIVSTPVKEAAIRREIKASATSRSKGLTLRPSKSKTPARTDGKPKDEHDLVQRTAARLEKLGLG